MIIISDRNLSVTKKAQFYIKAFTTKYALYFLVAPLAVLN